MTAPAVVAPAETGAAETGSAETGPAEAAGLAEAAPAETAGRIVPQPFVIKPAPTADEAAAIAAALAMLWPQPVPNVAVEDEQSKTRWRFSARTWAGDDRWSGWLHP